MKKLSLAFVFIYIAILGIETCCSAQSAKRLPALPNIVLILIYDMGYGDIVAQGGIDYSTPNIDKLAAAGMRFTNFYSAQPICTASRAGLLTGCYPNRIGLYGALGPQSTTGISDEEVSIPQMLKKKGYATGMIGKWHLGVTEKFLPLEHGFDEYFGLPYSNDMWPVDYDGKPITDPKNGRSKYPPLPLMEGNHEFQTIATLADQGTLTTQYTEHALAFIKEHKKQPFFLYLAHTMVHVPIAVSEKFRGKSKQGRFGDVMMEIDWSVGEVIQAIHENGLDKNTLIIFTSDNGPWLTFGNHAGSAGGLRGGKMTTFEGGQRKPSIMCWPGVVPAGQVCNKLASGIDILPTLAAITGDPLPPAKIDGVNIFPLLRGDTSSNPRDHFYYYYNKNSLQAIRQGSWKLVLPHKNESNENEIPGMNGWPGNIHIDSTGLALYDLRRDPCERYNVSEQNHDVVSRLLQIAEQAREDLGDDLTGRPGKNRRALSKL
jgi:arylsulfatase A-like enzyme